MLTTYNVLRSEVHFTQQQRRLREPKKYRSLPTPLTLVKWWRVCLGTSLSLSLSHHARDRDSREPERLIDNVIARECRRGADDPNHHRQRSHDGIATACREPLVCLGHSNPSQWPRYASLVINAGDAPSIDSRTSWLTSTDDLFGLLLFLGVEPINQRIWWRRIISQPLQDNDRDAVTILQHYLRTVRLTTSEWSERESTGASRAIARSFTWSWSA